MYVDLGEDQDAVDPWEAGPVTGTAESGWGWWNLHPIPNLQAPVRM